MSKRSGYKTIWYALLILLGMHCPRVQAQDLQHIKEEKWATIHGNFGACAWFYGINGIAPRRVPFSWLITGDAVLTLKGVSLPFSFHFSEQQRDFRQPFNQFGISPTYKWVKLHLGYRSLSFSRYTLDGHVFLGAGIELNPGKLRFAAMYGRLQKAVKEDTTKQIYNSVSQYPYAAYDRLGYAVKLGVGTERNFFDLIYFKGKDRQEGMVNNPEVQQVQPAENASLGIKTRLTFFKKLSFEADAGLSLYTRDLRADTVNLKDEAWHKLASIFLEPRLSTSIYYAGDATLQYKAKNFGFAFKYARIMPDYKSMGIYYMQTDVERYIFAPAYNSSKNTIQASGNIGFERDDLENKKLAKTNRLIGALNLNLNPKPEWGLSIAYANFGITQQPGLKSINDTVALNQVTHSITFTPRYTLAREGAIHTLVYLFTDQILNDRNKINSQNLDMSSINNTLSYVVFINKLDLSIDASFYHVNTIVTAGTSKSTGASIGGNRNFLKNKLSSTLNGTYATNSFEGQNDGYTIQMRTSHQYKVNKHHQFKMDLTYTNNLSKSEAVNGSFNEWLCMVGYNFSF
jgi:hypothetical protein